MYQQVEFTRDQLHQMVWDRPVLVIAKEIGVSDVALAKACRRAGIPLPGRGYWAALKSGHKSKAPALPALTPGQPSIVQFSVLENPPEKRPKLIGASVDPIEVSAQLTKPHRLVAELQVAAKGAREDKGVLALNYNKVLRVRTSAQHLQRALALLDVLIKQVEARGYKVHVGREHAETDLVLKEGVISFRLDERTAQTSPPPPPPRVGGKGRYQPEYEPWRPAYVLVGTGEFTLDFGKYQLDGCRRVWKDRRGCPLEAQLHEVIEALPSWEAALKVRRLKGEDREAKQRSAEERRVAEARAKEIVRRQRAALVKNLEAWEQAERLRRFAAAVESASNSLEAMAWLEWAKVQIDALDPLRSNLGGVTDLEVQLESYFTGPSSWDKPLKDWWS